MTEPRFVRLSDSPIWRLQRAYFEAQGPRAWASGTVPHYVTSNPFLARAFAEVIAGFAADRARARPAARPLYIVELGAGAGRLGFHIARALRGALDVRAAGWRPVYVLTDLAEETVAWWLAHPWLRPLFDAGLLDVARFDATEDDALELRVSGRRIDADQPADELVAVANYVFDSLPHDVFEHDAGTLYEWWAAVPDLEVDPGGDGFDAVEPSWRRQRAPASVYDDPVHDAIVDDHRAGAGVFTIPYAAIGALDRLRSFTRGPLLVLSADKGATRLDQVVGDELPVIVNHGSVSMMVNYHAIGRWAAAHGGALLHPEHRRSGLETCAIVVGDGPRHATTAAFERALAQRGPDDFYALKKFLVAHADALSLAELLAYLRLSGYDAKVFLDCAAALQRACATAGPDLRADLALAIARVWDGYLPIGEGRDLAGVLAALSDALGRADDACWFRAASRALRGEGGLARTAPLDDPFAMLAAAG